MHALKCKVPSVVKKDSVQFTAICRDLLQKGFSVRFTAQGESMRPNILPHDQVVVAPAPASQIKSGQVVLAQSCDGLRVHRMVQRLAEGGAAITRGDAGQANDAAAQRIFGKVVALERGKRNISLTGWQAPLVQASRTVMHRLRQAAVLRLKRIRSMVLPAGLLILFGALGNAAPAVGQALTISNTAASPVAPGGTITYTQVISNTSGVAVTQVINVTQTLPAGTTFVSAAKTAGDDPWTCGYTAMTNLISCADTSMSSYANNDTTTFTVVVTVSAGATNGSTITDTVSAQGANTAMVSQTANVTVQTPDISMTQSAAPNPVASGGTITYTETVTDNSAQAAAGAALTQSTPTGTTFASATPPAGWACGTKPAVGGTGSIVCTATGLVAGNSTSGNFTIVVTVDPEATVGSTITNTATVSETGTDPIPGNNTTTSMVTVSGADLAMTQTVSPTTSVAQGGTITYTETVTNNGPNAAVGPVLYQQTPPNTTFSSITAPAGWTCGTQPASGGTGQVICTDGTSLASGTTTTAFTFVVTVIASTAAGTTIQNWADVTSQSEDSNPANNATITSELVEITADADLGLTATAQPTPVFVSSLMTYTIVVTNQGLAAGTVVQVVDTLPSTLATASATTTQGTCGAQTGGTMTGGVMFGGTITCALGTVAYPLATPITITVTGTTPNTAQTLTNTAAVTTSGTDPFSGNNSVTVMTVVQPLVCATPGKDGAGGSLSGIVNTYYAGVGTAAAGTNSITVTTPSLGASTQIGVGDLLLVMQMQGAQINDANTNGTYGDGIPGNPASGSTNLENSGQFEFVTVTAVTVGANTDTLTVLGTGAGSNPGLLNSYASVAASNSSIPPQGIQTFQVIRVPQYTSATLSSTLTALGWNGAVGGVLALDVQSQLTLAGTVSLDGLGFRGGGGMILGGGSGSATDVVALSTNAANAAKGEGIAGTPHFVAPTQSTITLTTTATSTAQTYLEGYPAGSSARGAPGNAGGGGTDAAPASNSQNSGGGAGANGGAGGSGGFGWSSAGLVGGFGGVAFPATTSALVMGGGGGAGTTNNGTSWNPVTDSGPANNCGAQCTGIYSSGTAGGGIVIIHAGSLTPSSTGTISAGGQNGLEVENDGGGGGGAGGTILVQANSGGLSGLTANAIGGNGGITWPEDPAGGSFPGNRHGPGGGGGGGVVFTSSAPGGANVTAGIPGTTTLANDAYGATPGLAGITANNVTIAQTPGVQPGAECAGADLAVTNTETPNPVAPGGTITYTQAVSNAGPFDALNASFSEAIPGSTTFSSITAPAGWTCNSAALITSTGLLTCTDPDVAQGASGTFTLAVNVNAGTTFGTQITDTATITSGTNDPNLTNNTATATTVVGSSTNSAYVTLTKTAAANTVVAGSNITYTLVMKNNGPAAGVPEGLYDTVPTNTTFVSITSPGWSCNTPALNGTGNIACTTPSFANGATATFTLVVNVNSGVSNGTIISNTANANSAIPNPNPTAASATATVTVAGALQSDLSITSSVTPNPVYNNSSNPTFTHVVTNNGPAAVASASYVDTLPANATFVSLTPPAGWSCGAPVTLMSVTTVTCTGPLAVGGTATFPLVEQITAADTAGTVITNSATIGPMANDPNTANNTASSSTVVAAPSQADVSIVKTATPEPVDQNTNLNYTLQVTNNGPAPATGVTVSDPLPSQVSFTNVSTTQGSCTQTSGTVNCTIGTMNVGAVVLITINVNAATFSGSGGTVCNTVNGVPYSVCNIATVNTSSSDPDSANNKSEADSTIQSPTAVQLSSFRAQTRQNGGVLLEWHTQEEIRNLGFNVYREDAQGRHRVNPSIIAGAALFVRGAQPQHGAKTYYWIDPAGTAESSYVLEDVDLNGTRATHGPVSPSAPGTFADSFAQSTAAGGPGHTVAAAATQSVAEVSNAPLLTQLNQLAPRVAQQTTRALQIPRAVPPALTPGKYQVALDLLPALKISISSEGWYQLSHAQLIAAGFNPGFNPQFLQLFAEGIEQPMLVHTEPVNRLRPIDGIEFYGTGIDTPFSGTRVYWLVRGTQPGKRVTQIPASASGTTTAQDFLFTVIHEDRTTYFATLLNGENQDNFFGDAVTTEPVDEQLTIAHFNANSALQATVDVSLQGGTDQQAHSVSVNFNGNPIGEMDFLNQANVTKTFPINSSLLQDGVNTVTLAALNGDNDVSLVQSVALHYPHTYAADANWLRASATSGASLNITGFTNAQIFAYDITDPTAITQLVGTVQPAGNTFSLALAVPSVTAAEHTLLILSADQISVPPSLALHLPDPAIHRQQSSDIVIISHPDFVASLAPYVAQRQQQGRNVTVITTDQLYDAFNYGERSPFALRDYLQQLSAEPAQAPQAVLLMGDASLDPRNYLGFGDFDFVPTRIIETQAFKTASDDWFSDFQQNGFATIPTGRIPVRTASDAALVINKIVSYESGSTAGAWNQQAVLIADQNIGINFTDEATFAATELPASLESTRILADSLDVDTARQQILTALNSGALLVNYTGHGSNEQWSFSDLFDGSTAATLTNGDHLPVFLLMDCLNGFFQDVYTESLAQSLLLAPNGGAVAVWASSGFTSAPPQATLDQAFLRIIKNDPATALGEGVLNAKLGITDPDVRRTWIFFGDPSMQLQLSGGVPLRIPRRARRPVFKIKSGLANAKEGN
jgi:uncharacterized repeat protein (TIGR01451 family)